MKSNESYSKIFDRYKERSLVITDPRLPDNPIVYATKAFFDLTGYSEDEVIGQNCRFLQGPDTEQASLQKIGIAIREAQKITIEITNYKKNGISFKNRLTIKPYFDHAGKLETFLGLQEILDK